MMELITLLILMKMLVRKIEIDQMLYDIITEAEELKVDMNGYFDISIGKIIDEWKYLINLEKKLSKNEFKKFKEKCISNSSY